MSESPLHYAEFIRNVLNAADQLDKAGMNLVAAKDDKLFHEIHAIRMKLLDMAESLIKNPRDKKWS